MRKGKAQMKRYIRYFAVAAAAVLIFVGLGVVLEPNYDGNKALKGFYRQERNTADVIFYGSSHVYAGINVIDLWDDYGIAAYDLAGTMQTLWNSYYNMRETLKYQSPKVMVVDLYGALVEEEYYTVTNVIKNADSMRFSFNKLQNIWSSVPHGDFASYILAYPLRHDRYKSLEREDYVAGADDIGGRWYKGFHPVFGVTEYDSLPAVPESAAPGRIFWKNREYLNRMVELAEENQIELIFTVVPYAAWQAEDEEVYTWVEAFAAEHGIAFVNGNRKAGEFALDPRTDYAEGSHLNYSGASKFTEYLGRMLRDDYGIEDRRQDARYVSWQNYSDCWAAYLQDCALARITDAGEYLDALKEGGDYVLLISVDDKFRKNPYIDALRGLSSECDPFNFESNGTYVLEAGQLLYQTPNEPEYLWYEETDSLDVAVVRNYGGQMQLLVNNVQQNNNANDVTIVVYDRINDRVADTAAFNSDGVILR